MQQKKPQPGEFYRHFKGNLYQVLQLATHSETGEELVIYQALYGQYGVYARPLSMFVSPVDKEKYPAVSQTYRFECTSPQALVQEIASMVNPQKVQELCEDSQAERVEEEEPLIVQFLDCESEEEKIRFVKQHKLKLNNSFFLVAAESLGYTETQKTLDARLEELIHHLKIKMRYESVRLR
jgi:hypothetical protein